MLAARSRRCSFVLRYFPDGLSFPQAHAELFQTLDVFIRLRDLLALFSE